MKSNNSRNEFEAFLRLNVDPDTREVLRGNSAVICLASSGTPVMYVSDAFEAHTGYPAAEVIGRSLKILQGPETEPESISHFRRLIKDGVSGIVRITNYRKNGSPFLHECALRPIRSASGELTHFVAIQTPVVFCPEANS
ncbi:PAS domain-containing protein [Yoonia litorea]|uniref:PAS domain S-box-containing protein n=1 Tax=Yoonia litorea TaxID=1123755 RepID=A0A1I6MI66_9RHOB|nr:PAS domain-containing protein [Yoonia litorea]SFS15353.1 PAS domain S-box-containing protein [Yoonia litorea]